MGWRGVLYLLTVSLAGAQFSLSRSGGAASLRAGGQVAVPKLATLSFSGAFSHGAAGTLFELTSTGAVNPAGYNFGTGTFALYRRQSRSSTSQGLSALASVNIPGLGAGQAWMSITSEPTLSFGLYLGVNNGTIGQVLGYPTAYVRFFSGGRQVLSIEYLSRSPFIRVTIRTVQVTVLELSASVHNVMKLPGSFNIYGSISSTGAYSPTASVEAGPWSWHKDVGICTARLSASGSFQATVQGTANSLSISVGLDASASARCGSIGVSAGATADFGYSPPNTFSGSVKGRIHVSGIGTWRPTLLDL
ncbi:MAG: hypothetical protein JWM89_3686 [Acidimicrobiales bacterium]|nr:hypothetical protein [Acidimicrobiales bacterium]